MSGVYFVSHCTAHLHDSPYIELTRQDNYQRDQTLQYLEAAPACFIAPNRASQPANFNPFLGAPH
jgi:hypothetical protein